MIAKYIDDKSCSTKHWEYCEKYKVPYIEIETYSEKYSIIFCDITNLSIDLELVSEKLKYFYSAYLEFLQLNESIFDVYKDQFYFMTFLVKKEHCYDLASYLFEYIQENYKG